MAAEENPSIIPLVKKWEEFKLQDKYGSVEQFAVWVLREGKVGEREAQNETQYESGQDPVLKNMVFKGEYPGIPTASGIAGYIVVRLFKALRFYFKPVLQKHSFSSIDELFFLATLAWKGSINKKTLCQLNMTDIPTGMDIIKRLIKQGLMSEKENPEDKRGKLLSLTEAGWEKIYQVFAEGSEIQDVMSDLDSAERTALLKLLDRLNHFHTQMYDYSS